MIFHVLLMWQSRCYCQCLPFTICKVKAHLGPSQFDNATLRKIASFNSWSCLSSWFFSLLSITLNYSKEISLSRNTLLVLDSVMWLSSTSLHLWLLISVWQSGPDQLPLGNTSSESLGEIFLASWRAPLIPSITSSRVQELIISLCFCNIAFPPL